MLHPRVHQIVVSLWAFYIWLPSNSIILSRLCQRTLIVSQTQEDGPTTIKLPLMQINLVYNRPHLCSQYQLHVNRLKQAYTSHSSNEICSSSSNPGPNLFGLQKLMQTEMVILDIRNRETQRKILWKFGSKTFHLTEIEELENAGGKYKRRSRYTL